MGIILFNDSEKALLKANLEQMFFRPLMGIILFNSNNALSIY